MEFTAYRLAARYLGIEELPGGRDHPLIQWWLLLCGFAPDVHDETPWCAGYVNHVAWLLGLPRPRFPARARSWLTVGLDIKLDQAEAGWDIVVLKRGSGDQPDASVLDAPGHVGFFANCTQNDVQLLGGNQSDCVSIESYDRSRVLGVRRLRWL